MVTEHERLEAANIEIKLIRKFLGNYGSGTMT